MTPSIIPIVGATSWTPSIAIFLICVGILILAWTVNNNTRALLKSLNEIATTIDNTEGISVLRKFIELTEGDNNNAD